MSRSTNTSENKKTNLTKLTGEEFIKNINEGLINFENVTVTGDVKLENVKLENVELINVDFSQATCDNAVKLNNFSKESKKITINPGVIDSVLMGAKVGEDYSRFQIKGSDNSKDLTYPQLIQCYQHKIKDFSNLKIRPADTGTFSLKTMDDLVFENVEALTPREQNDRIKLSLNEWFPDEAAALSVPTKTLVDAYNKQRGVYAPVKTVLEILRIPKAYDDSKRNHCDAFLRRFTLEQQPEKEKKIFVFPASDAKPIEVIRKEKSIALHRQGGKPRVLTEDKMKALCENFEKEYKLNKAWWKPGNIVAEANKKFGKEATYKKLMFYIEHANKDKKSVTRKILLPLLLDEILKKDQAATQAVKSALRTNSSLSDTSTGETVAHRGPDSGARTEAASLVGSAPGDRGLGSAEQNKTPDAIKTTTQEDAASQAVAKKAKQAEAEKKIKEADKAAAERAKQEAAKQKDITDATKTLNDAIAKISEPETLMKENERKAIVTQYSVLKQHAVLGDINQQLIALCKKYQNNVAFGIESNVDYALLSDLVNASGAKPVPAIVTAFQNATRDGTHRGSQSSVTPFKDQKKNTDFQVACVADWLKNPDITALNEHVKTLNTDVKKDAFLKFTLVSEFDSMKSKLPQQKTMLAAATKSLVLSAEQQSFDNIITDMRKKLKTQEANEKNSENFVERIEFLIGKLQRGEYITNKMIEELKKLNPIDATKGNYFAISSENKKTLGEALTVVINAAKNVTHENAAKANIANNIKSLIETATSSSDTEIDVNEQSQKVTQQLGKLTKTVNGHNFITEETINSLATCVAPIFNYEHFKNAKIEYGGIWLAEGKSETSIGGGSGLNWIRDNPNKEKYREALMLQNTLVESFGDIRNAYGDPAAVLKAHQDLDKELKKTPWTKNEDRQFSGNDFYKLIDQVKKNVTAKLAELQPAPAVTSKSSANPTGMFPPPSSHSSPVVPPSSTPSKQR